jgi:hypothetical protein
MIIVTAKGGLLPCPSKGQLHQARCPHHRKGESQRLSIGLNTATRRRKSLLRIDYATAVRALALVPNTGGNRFVRPLLTVSSVIAVMPACMLTVPNPGSRNGWPVHCDGGIHYVWPFKF